jgi:ankyrin
MGDSFSNPLHRAVQECDETAVRHLLTRWRVNSLDGIRFTSNISPLQVAAKAGHLPIVAMLLEMGARINHKDSEGKTALIYASEQGHSAVVSHLLSTGADINAADKEGLTPLHCATRYCQREVVEILLKADANVNALNTEGRTALADISFLGDVVAWDGDLSITLLLLQAGTDLTMGGGRYMTPLHLAARFGTTEEVRAILDAGADVNARGGHDEPALQAACDRPFQSSAHATVDLLLERGVNVHITGGACHTAFFAAAGIGDTDMIASLLEKGADVNYIQVLEFNGTSAIVTALGIAAQQNQKMVAGVLLRLGASPDCHTAYGHPAIMAVSHSWRGDEIFSALIEAGANVNLRSLTSLTALYEAASTGSYSKVRRLLEAGAIIQERESLEILHAAVEGGNLSVFELLKARTSPIKGCIENTTTLMHTAASYGQVAIIRKLLKLQNAIQARDETGKTPLHLAARMGHSKVVNILINAGSSVHAQDLTRMTPLHLAAEDGQEDVVKILLRWGADPNARDKKGRTPFKVAALGVHIGVSTLIQNSPVPRKLRPRPKSCRDIVLLVRYFYFTMIVVLEILVLRDRLQGP